MNMLMIRHCRTAFVPLRVYSSRRQFSVSLSHGIKKETVTDGDITRLAAKPLHPLTLADLVKYDQKTSIDLYQGNKD